MSAPAIIVHGGSAEIPSERESAFRSGCLEALQVARVTLEEGGTALDAVEAAIRVLESDPIFNAGKGSALNANGEVEMDAAIMEGNSLRAGAVACLQGVQHPISAARRLLENGKAVMLAGAGAWAFAKEQGLELCAPDFHKTDRQRQALQEQQPRMAPPSRDTVGCVVRDAQGNFAAGTSTGGLTGKLPGRIGDSPLVGCGLYAGGAGTTSLTGDGESIIRVALASRIMFHLECGMSAMEAAQAGVDYFHQQVPGEMGCIVIDRQGRTGWAHNSAHLPVAFWSSKHPTPTACIRKESKHEVEFTQD